MRMFSVKNSTRRKPRNSKPLTFVIKDRGIVVVCGVKLHPQVGRWLQSRLPRVVSEWKIYFTKRRAWALVCNAVRRGALCQCLLCAQDPVPPSAVGNGRNWVGKGGPCGRDTESFMWFSTKCNSTNGAALSMVKSNWEGLSSVLR